MKIVVTGSCGMLGSAVMPRLKELGHSAAGLDLAESDAARRVDIADWSALKAFKGFKDCELILHMAAATNVDQCEKEPDTAFRVNTLATQYLARLSAEREIPILYVSTAAVFAGNKKTEPYTEFDAPAPVNVYAQSKWQGEQAVRELNPRHFIVRAGWMMGGGVQEKKFVGKIVEQLLGGKKDLMAVSDKKGTVSYTVDFARHLMPLVSSGHYGTYHLVNRGSCTRYDIAKKIVEHLGSAAKVEAVPSSRFPLPAPRPDSECLRNYKLELMGMDDMPAWDQALKAYLDALVPALKA